MTGWTEDRSDDLKRLWVQGHSAAQISRYFGDVSRNAVIGKLHRLGYAGSPQAPRRESTPLRAPRRAPHVPPPPPIPEPEPVTLPDGDRYSTATILRGLCRWPYGDPLAHDFHFCGHKAIAGKPVCEFHHRVMYQPPKKRGGNPAEIARMERESGLRKTFA